MKLRWVARFFIAFLVVSSSQTNANQQPMIDLASQYAVAVGSINFLDQVTQKLSEHCGEAPTLSAKELNEVDYLLRKKTNVSYLEYIELMDSSEDTSALVEEANEQLLALFKDCSAADLTAWRAMVALPQYEQHIAALRDLSELFGLPIPSRQDSEIVGLIEELASALEWGGYRYSLFYNVKVAPQPQRAKDLRDYLFDITQDPAHLFRKAVIEQRTNRDEALATYTKAAELGHGPAEIWLGTYHACNEQFERAKNWLNRARGKDPVLVGDIFAEIDELGMPTNCYEGWVH
jgi:tetratricopeptide (TPR) repeat protein